MKSPYKVSWTALKMTAIGGLVIDALLVFLNGGDALKSLGGILILIGLYLVFLFMGVVLSCSNAPICNRKVSHPVNPEQLVVDQIYWLNGETHARYLGVDAFSRNYYFNIYGVGESNTATSLFEYYVRNYISAEEETE